MKRFLLCVMTVLFLFSGRIDVTATVVGDGYGTIGGGDVSTPVQPPVVVVPQDPVTVVPAEQPAQQSVSQEKVIEKNETPKKESNKENSSSVPEETVSKNTISKKLTPPSGQKKTEPKKEEEKKLDIHDLLLEKRDVVVDEQSFSFGVIARVLKILTTIVLSYVIVFTVFAVLILPKLYVLHDNGNYRLTSILLIREKEDGFYIKIPKRVLFYGADTNPAKICFLSRFVKKQQGNTLYVKTGNRCTSYMIEKEVLICITREED